MVIVFLARSIAGGGAERQLLTLAAGLARRGHRVSIIVFYDSDRTTPLPPGVRLVSAGKRSRWDLIGLVPRLARLIRREHPDILHAYLPVPNCLAILLRPWLRGIPAVLGLRASDMELRHYDGPARWAYRLERRLARFADLLIANSEAVRRHVLALGYPAARVRVIPNGIDTTLFRPDPEGSARLRATWGVASGAPLVGVVGRLDPMKDHASFLRALARLTARHPSLRAVLAGEGPPAFQAQLEAEADALGVGSHLIWAGTRQDMAAVYSALDLLCLSSAFGEGFPNVVAEAMACAVPCVVTDVGDAATIVGETGRATRRRDPEGLAEALDGLLGLPEGERRALGARARDRILAHYTVDRLVDSTLAALDELRRAR